MSLRGKLATHSSVVILARPGIGLGTAALRLACGPLSHDVSLTLTVLRPSKLADVWEGVTLDQPIKTINTK